MRWGMLIDLIKCAACYGCAVKCKQEHFLPPFVMWGKILMSEEGKYPNAIINKVPVLCNHCEDAVCVEVCPTGAIPNLTAPTKHKVSLGNAEIDRAICIAWADNQECIVCEEHCPVEDKAIKLIEEVVNGQAILRPYVDKELCIGCGICQNKCPVRPVRAIRVNPRERRN